MRICNIFYHSFSRNIDGKRTKSIYQAVALTQNVATWQYQQWPKSEDNSNIHNNHKNNNNNNTNNNNNNSNNNNNNNNSKSTSNNDKNSKTTTTMSTKQQNNTTRTMSAANVLQEEKYQGPKSYLHRRSSLLGLRHHMAWNSTAACRVCVEQKHRTCCRHLACLCKPWQPLPWSQ